MIPALILPGTAANLTAAQENPSVNASERRIVRVAFPEQAGMSSIDHNGRVFGYNYDYLEKISEYTGWEMEYVTYPSDDGIAGTDRQRVL